MKNEVVILILVTSTKEIKYYPSFSLIITTFCCNERKNFVVISKCLSGKILSLFYSYRDYIFVIKYTFP